MMRIAPNDLLQTICVKQFASNILLITDNSYTMRKAPNDLRQTICAKRFASNDLRQTICVMRLNRTQDQLSSLNLDLARQEFLLISEKNFFSETFFLTLLLFLQTLVD